MTTTFAIYSETDNSLNFYNRENVPTIGDTFEDKVVTKIYTGFETTAWTDSTTVSWRKDGTIQNIKISTVVDTISPISINGWWRDGQNITFIDLSNLDTSNCTNMGYVFRDCSLLTNIVGLTYLNTSKVTHMKSMFYNCAELEEIDVSGFDTGLVTNMEYMFYSCFVANIIGLNNFDVKNVTSFRSMFYKCVSTKHFDLSGWNLAKCTSTRYMFNRAAGTVDFTGWDTSKITDMTSMFSTTFFTYLDLSSFNVSSATSLKNMFYSSYNLKTILVSYNWNESFADNVDTTNMFANCNVLMGDVSYDDIISNTSNEEELSTSVSGIYATTNGGYLVLKYDEDSSEDGETGNNGSLNEYYLVQTNTLTDIANNLRNVLGVPQRIYLKNFSKILNNQIGSIESVSLLLKDTVFNKNDDTSFIATLHYLNSDKHLLETNLNRLAMVPTVMKNSIIVLSNVVSLNENTTIVCKGDITQIGDSLAFLITGDATIEIVEKLVEPEEEGAGSSGEIPTCTVKFVVGENAYRNENYLYTKCVDGIISAEVENEIESQTVILENVVCGSVIYFPWLFDGDTPETTINGGVIGLDGGNATADFCPKFFQAQTEPNTTSVITVSSVYDGGDMPYIL